jgi:hypothetical protein
MSYRSWQHVERGRRAFEALELRAARGSSMQIVGLGGGEQPEVLEHGVRFAATAGGWFREERDEHVTVRGPGGLVMWSPQFGAVAHEDNGSMRTTAHELLDPLVTAVGYDLEPLDETAVAGRRAHRVRAVPRGERWHLHGLPRGADAVELAVDAERGVLLRTEAWFEGEPFAVDDVTAIEFDVELPAETFVFELPPGELVRTPDEAFPWAYVSIEEAASRASFTVYVPSGLDARWKVNAIHREADERSRTTESVHLLFFDDALHNFTLEEAGEPLLAWRVDEPELVLRGGVELQVRDGKRPGPPAEVRLERAGTHIRVSSDTLDAERLVAVAAALVEAPTQLPPV